MMSTPVIRWLAIGAAAAALAVIAASGMRAQGFAFWTLESGYTQELFGVTRDYLATPPAKGYLGGVAVLQDGDVLVAECETSTTRLHRFDATATFVEQHTVLHQESVLATRGGCGITFHPDGYLYSNMHDGTNGVSRIDPVTGAFATMGPPGNALGIAVDPLTNHLVYPDAGCKPQFGSSPTCTIVALDPATGDHQPFAVLPTSLVAYVDGIAFEPDGAYLFLTNRFPTWDLVVLDRSGQIVRSVPMWSEPVGIGFHAGTPAYVVTNNQDGTLTRFDFPADNYAALPQVREFASGGFRGDLMQAGPDGCLYLTQDGVRYDTGDEDWPEPGAPRANSVVRVCGGFAPPPGIVPHVADMTVRIMAPPAAEGGQAISYTVQATHAGDDPARDVVLTHAVPEDARITGLDLPDGWSCASPPPGTAGTISCTTPRMAAGEIARLMVTAVVGCPAPASGRLPLAASVTSPTTDPNPGNNTAASDVQVANPAPVITGAAATPGSLWPPNHKMHVVDVAYEIEGCAGLVSTATLDVSSSERVTGRQADWRVVDPHTVELRAERRGNSPGRTYTITITAREPGGRTATAGVFVTVPHDQSGQDRGGKKNGKSAGNGNRNGNGNRGR